MQQEQLAPGTVIAGRYRVGRRLGRGGMADVYEGADERLQRPVAVKVLRSDMASRGDIRARFEVEARHAARLSHPNVVAVYDTGEDDGLPYIVMERLPGETLADRIARGPVDATWLRRVAGDVLEALVGAHSAGIVHRDIKPGNILIASNGCAKVTDFGIAKTLEVAQEDRGLDATGTNQLVGTPAYLAPERIEGAPATPASDIYSLGVVLYEALAGDKPFNGGTAIAIADAVQRSTPPSLGSRRPDVDPRFVEVIERAMARRPEDRFPSASAMRNALPPVNEVEDATAVIALDDTRAETRIAPRPSPAPPPAAAPTRPQRRPSPLWPVAILLGILLLGLGVVMALADDGGADEETSDAAPPIEEIEPDPVVARLRDAAESLAVGDGEGGREVSRRLLEVAAQVEDGRGADEANALLRDVARMRADGRLGVRASQVATDALLQVPGADPNAAVVPASASTPAADDEGGGDERGNGKGNGKGKEKGEDDDD